MKIMYAIRKSGFCQRDLTMENVMGILQNIPDYDRGSYCVQIHTYKSDEKTMLTVVPADMFFNVNHINF